MSAYDVVAAVKDPELPVITIAELGVLRDVSTQDGQVTVTITPTYSGCPAMDAIRSDIRAALSKAGHPDVEIITKLSPPWSTDMISESGRAALARSGIAPPPAAGRGPVAVRIQTRAGAGGFASMGAEPGRAGVASGGFASMGAEPGLVCPRCGSADVVELSRYASTACQSLWRCRSCVEPFNAVKPI